MTLSEISVRRPVFATVMSMMLVLLGALLIMPQPRFTVALPPIGMPGVSVFSSASTQ